MANGYIGKISAVVTANTSDLSRKLSGATADVDKFANSVNASLTRLEKSGAESLNKLFTPLQNLERKFKAALDFNIRTEESVAKLRQIVSVSEGINKPLAQAATAFSRLTLEVQGSFLPALNRAQDSVLLLNRKVNETGSVSAKAFGIVERIVARTASAIQRLGEAQRLVASGPNANSLALSAPRVSQTLQASAAARQQAAGLPASELADGSVARQVGNLSAVENRIAEVQGRIEALQLRPKVDTVQLEAARKELDRLLAGAERIRAGIQVRVDAQKAIADTASLSQRLDQLQENANFSITGTPQNLRQVEAELGRVLGQFDSLNEAQRESLGAQFGAQFSRVADALRSGNLPQAIQDFQLLEASVKLAANETERLARATKLLTVAPDQSPPPSPRTALGDRLSQAGADRIRVLTGSTNIDSTPVPGVFNQQAQRDIDALASRVGAVRQQLESLPNSLRSQFVPALQQAQQRLIALQNSPKATAAQIARATAEVENLEAKAKRAAASLSLPSFTDFMDDFSTKRAIGELNAFGQVLERVGAFAGGAGAKAYEAYRARLAEAIRTGTTGLPEVRRELQQLAVDGAKAAAATGKISFSAALRAIQRGGDIGRGAGGNAGLAIQQAIFAFDDFISVTGGLDQRIRAAGNNISQLGFILGGTAGLITGVVVSAIAQLGAGFVRWYTEADKAEAATKRLNDALQSQQSRTQSLADSYRQLADAIAQAGLSEQARQERSRREPFREIEREQAARRRDIATANAPQIGAAQARIDAIDKELEQEENLLRRRALLTERRRRQAEIDNEISLIERQGQRFADTAIRFQPGDAAAIRSLERGPSGLQETRAGLARAERRGDAAAVERLSRQLASLEVAIQLLRDRQVNRGFERQQEVSDRLARTQQNLQGVGGFRFSDFLGSEITGRIEDLRSQFAGDADLFQALSGPLNNLSASLEAASNQVAEFAAALERGAVEIARAAEQDLSQQSQSLRRQANAAEASFGADDPRTRLLRDQQDRAEAARQQATRNRLEIERQASRQRLAFEESAILGRGGGEAAGIGNRIAELQRLMATPATDQLGVTERENARLEVDRLRARLGEIFDALPGTQELRRRADEGDVFAQRQIQQIESETRGRELSLTPAQRAAEEMNRQMQDIRNRFATAAENSDGLPASVEKIREQLAAAIGRTREDILRGVAPAVFALADEVQNSILQGPSRAALGATDASTIEGQRELNRLLRGDDPNREVDLVELQRQSNRLLETIADNTGKENQVAN